MIKLMPQSNEAVLGFQAGGKLTDDDYKQTFLPKLEEALKVQGKLKTLLYLDETFEGWELKAMWDDAAWGKKHRDDFEKLAIVGASAWVEWGSKAGSHFMGGELKTFSSAELDQAWEWVAG